MRGGRWGREVVIEHAGVPMRLFPTQIVAADYTDGIQWSTKGSPEEACAKTELARMFRIYERFGAVMQPLRYTNGRTVWCVEFPQQPKSRWKNGPERPSAFQALVDNYAGANGKFHGYDMSEPLHRTTDLKKLDSIIDSALARDKAHAEGVLAS